MKSCYLACIVGSILVLCALSCGTKGKPLPGRYYTGLLFGKPYAIDVVGDSADYQPQFDSIIRAFEKQFNTLDPSSTLSKYNAFTRKDTMFEFVDTSMVFGIVYDQMRDLNAQTMRYYDPTINPLKTAWMAARFSGSMEPNLDSIFQFVGFDGAKMDLTEISADNYVYQKSNMRKADPRIEADFTSLAMAVALDHIADFLKSKNVLQFRIKSGQNTICYGSVVDSLSIVPMGVINDSSDQVIRLSNAAFSFKTSQDKMALVDPTYGYPVDNEMVYVATSSPTLGQSEAFAEAFLVMGLDKAAVYYSQNEESKIQSFIFYKADDKELHSASTEGFDRLIIIRDSLSNPLGK